MLCAFYGVFTDRSLTCIIALPLFLTIGKRWKCNYNKLNYRQL